MSDALERAYRVCGGREKVQDDIPESIVKTAEKLGMSQVQVSRKERAVLAIMRKKLTDDYSQSAT